MDGEQPTIEEDEPVKGTRTSTHKSARAQRVEVITRGERYRRWSLEQKREIVAESLRPGSRPSELIRKYGISSGQLYTWRGQLAQRLDGEVSRPAVDFARVDVVAVPQQAATAAYSQSRAEGLIEIVLPGGVFVRVDGRVDIRALRSVLDVFAKR